MINLNISNKDFFDALKSNDILLFNEIFYYNSYCVDAKEVRGKNVLDIGAHIGYFALFTAFMDPLEIISVEPSSYNFVWLHHNTRCIDDIRLIKKAVTGVDRGVVRVRSSVGAERGFKSTDANVFGSTGELVETINLPRLLTKFKNPEVDIILKLDVEGSEYDILQSCSRDDLQKVSIIHLEEHLTLHPQYKGKKILDEKLTELGFREVYSHPIFKIDGYGKNMEVLNPRECGGEIAIVKWVRA